MFKIKIEETFNPNSEMAGKWFVRYDENTDKPLFTDNETEAGIFVIDFRHKDALYGNLMALYDRFNIRGTAVSL